MAVLLYYHKARALLTMGASPYITGILFGHWWHVALRYRLQRKDNVSYCVELDVYWLGNPCWYWGRYFLLKLFINLNTSQVFGGTLFWEYVYSVLSQPSVTIMPLAPTVCNLQVWSHLALPMLNISLQLVTSWWYHQSSGENCAHAFS